MRPGQRKASQDTAKHIDIKVKHLWSMKKAGEIEADYLESGLMKADLMTKPFSAVPLTQLKKLVGIRSREAPTATQDETT